MTPVLALALALLLSGPRAGADPASDAACFLAKANEARAARGYPALATDPTLTSLANAQAQDMARMSRAVPIDNDTLVAKAPPGAQVLGQNVGVGADCQGLHETFVNYPPDQNRILDPRFDKIGVGVAPAGDAIYVSEILMVSGPPRPGQPKASVAPAPPPVVRVSPSPARSPAASPSPVETAASPAPSVVPSESPAAPSVPVAPSPSASVSVERVSKSRGVPLLVAFALLIVGAAALGALVQTRRSRR
jgi:hypothetical protein